MESGAASTTSTSWTDDVAFLMVIAGEGPMMLSLSQAPASVSRLWDEMGTHAIPELLLASIAHAGTGGEKNEEKSMVALQKLHHEWFIKPAIPQGVDSKLTTLTKAQVLMEVKLKQGSARHLHVAPQEVVNGLFIGGGDAAAQPGLLVALGITHVLCCYMGASMLKKFGGWKERLQQQSAASPGARGVLTVMQRGQSGDITVRDSECDERSYENLLMSVGIHRLALPMTDSDEHDLAEFFAPAADYIHSALHVAQGKVLVHCKLGRHRSAAMIAAYLTCRAPKPMELDAAIVLLGNTRSGAGPIPVVKAALEKHIASSG